MNRKKYIHTLAAPLLSAVLFASCELETEIPNPGSFARVYMPQAVDYPARRTLVMADTFQTVIYGAAYGGLGYPTADIEVSFRTDTSLAPAFNADNGTDYPLLPEGSYELTAAKGLIPAGALNTAPLPLRIKTLGNLELNRDYLLPVRMEPEGEGVPLNENLTIAYFLVRAELAEFNRSAWKIVTVSSEETEGEGAGNGHAKHAFDGDQTTFWHTQWAGGSPGHPHFITVDMSEARTIQGFSFIPRQGKSTGNPREMRIEVSNDGTGWEDAGTFTLENTDQKHTLFLPVPKEAVFFRITIDASHADTFFTHLAEIGAF
ncbi:MAG TPA: discoidin domain-containing protein [Anseongella sp.]|nr:discoidin domain-containing protein [Anseongella sp.]